MLGRFEYWFLLARIIGKIIKRLKAESSLHNRLHDAREKATKEEISCEKHPRCCCCLPWTQLWINLFLILNLKQNGQTLRRTHTHPGKWKETMQQEKILSLRSVWNVLCCFYVLQIISSFSFPLCFFTETLFHEVWVASLYFGASLLKRHKTRIITLTFFLGRDFSLLIPEMLMIVKNNFVLDC